jgi:NAD(P)H-hydrate epimerase
VTEEQLQILERRGIPGSDRAVVLEALPSLLATVDLVLDTLVGYRWQGVPREPIASLIYAANRASVPRLALDLPSGLEGDSGRPSAVTIQADATLTLAWPKTGLLAASARLVVGALFLADITVPAAVYQAVGVEQGDLFAEGPIVRVRPAPQGWDAECLLAGL